MKTQRLKNDNQYDKTVMYEFDFPTDIRVEEQQKESRTLDMVILHYFVKDGEIAYFSKEYIPVGTPKEGTKKPHYRFAISGIAE